MFTKKHGTGLAKMTNTDQTGSSHVLVVSSLDGFLVALGMTNA
jgi:hypothetical protein